MTHRMGRLLSLLLIVCLLVAPFVGAQGPVSPTADTPASDVRTSHRLIVELASPSLAAWYPEARSAGLLPEGQLSLGASAARQHLAALDAEQTAFLTSMQAILPEAREVFFLREDGKLSPARYQIAFNGLAIDPGVGRLESTIRALRALPGVRNVYLDYAYTPTLYASNPLIGAPTLWNSAAIGGRANAGSGVKVASMDGGIHKDAPMFSGEGYEYPAGYPAGGLGLTANNNGKIIASRAYFRTWDPPAPGDQNPWPGENGTSHGVHTASIMAGNMVDVDYLGYEVPDMSGVAPAAWVMSYRMFYNSISGDGSFYTVEGLAALEDIVRDGADVLNNSWGGGPGSLGGAFDALDTALVNASRAGVFVTMSAGNAGPGLGTGDHPSPDYISVAATSTDATLASGRLSVSAPTPVPDNLTGIPFAVASFGGAFPLNTVITHTLISTTSIDPTNALGCNPWDGTPFADRAVLVLRGDCEFGVKVLNAERAGAEMVIVYNNAGGGNSLISMGAGAVGDQVTIPSLFVGHAHGVDMVNWHDTHGDEATIALDTSAFQAGNEPDVLASFSSRGPGVGNVLKPDIAAPGVNILAQGYAPNTTGEDRHLGYGQASGTSMAAPHVAGAAALLRQAHPDWSNAYIKSALMSTAKYLDVYTHEGDPAQPLDMGAGRLDLTHATNPGVILQPPSLSYGLVSEGESASLSITLTSVASAGETYAISTLYTGDGFDDLKPAAGFAVSPTSVTLAPGASATVTVTFDSTIGNEIGDHQGYLVLDGATYHAHLPMWARVVPAALAADVLVIAADLNVLFGTQDYLTYYTDALEAAGYTYEVWDTFDYVGEPITIPSAAQLAAYRAVVLYTGDSFYPDGTFTVSTPLTMLDLDILTEYANAGGVIIAMGQDLSAVVGGPSSQPPFFYESVLGADYLQDSVTQGELPTLPVVTYAEAPRALEGLSLDLSGAGDGAANQAYIDELALRPFKAPDAPQDLLPYTPLLMYPGPDNVQRGIVAMAHRDQPTLERPGISYLGRSVFTTFGLEGVNNDTGLATRAELLGALLAWAFDEPSVSIVNVTPGNESKLVVLEANVTSELPGVEGVSYRWDMGDGSAFLGPYEANQASHTYQFNGTYTVRVEATDALGNRAVGELELVVTDLAVQMRYFLPQILNRATFTP